MIRLRMFCAMVGALPLLLGPPRAFGDMISFNLENANIGGLSCCIGPYAKVTVNRSSAMAATVTFDSLTNGGFLYLLAGNEAVDLNVNASAFTASVSGTNSLVGFSPGPYTNTGSKNVSSFGLFNLTVDSKGGFTESADQIVVTLSASGANWVTASDVLTANSDGSTAAIHGFACAEPGCSSTSQAFATGYASNGSVPEPTTLLYWGGLVGIAGLGFVRKRAASQV